MKIPSKQDKEIIRFIEELEVSTYIKSEQPKNMSKSKAPVVTGIKPKEAVPGTEITIRHSIHI